MDHGSGIKRKEGCLTAEKQKQRIERERHQSRNKSKIDQKSLWRFGVFTVTKSLHFTGFGPVSAERKAIHTPTQPVSLARKAWWG